MNLVSETHEAGSVLEASVNFSSPFFLTVTKAEMLFGSGEKVNLKFIIGVCEISGWLGRVCSEDESI